MPWIRENLQPTKRESLRECRELTDKILKRLVFAWHFVYYI